MILLWYYQITSGFAIVLIYTLTLYSKVHENTYHVYIRNSINLHLDFIFQSSQKIHKKKHQNCEGIKYAPIKASTY